MICKCRGCFRRIPDNTTLCSPCTPTPQLGGGEIPAWHGPGGSHGYLGAADDAQLDAIHDLLESLDGDEYIASGGTCGNGVIGSDALMPNLVAFYAAFRVE